MPDLHIVAATGCYTYDQVPFFLLYRDPAIHAAIGLGEATRSEIELFVGDITEGIADTGVKAAFLKCAIDHKGLTPGVGARHASGGARPTARPAPRSPCTPTPARRPVWSSSG